MRSSRAMGIAFIGAGGLVLAMCAFLFLAGGGIRRDSHIALVIGAGTVALGVHQLSSRAACLIFSDADFLSTIGDRIEIRWSDLASAQIATHSDDITYLILRLADRDSAELQSPTPWNRPTFDRPPDVEHDDIVLPITGLDATPERILRQIRGRIAHAAATTPARSS